MSTLSNLPTWDEMSDLDKGAALLHLHKRQWEGALYAVEHYPARFLEDSRLKALSPTDASYHAVRLRDDTNGLTPEEYMRLYNLALEADREPAAAPTLEGAAE